MEKMTGLAISAVYNRYMLWLFYVQTYRVQELSCDQRRRPCLPPPPRLPPPCTHLAAECVQSTNRSTLAAPG